MIGLRNAMAPWAAAARLLRGAWEVVEGAVDDLAFPTFCPICEASTDEPAFCRDCRGEILGAAGSCCDRCAMPVGPFADRTGGCSGCRGRSLGFDRAVALGPYQGPIRHACLMIKRERNAWVARWLAELLAEARFTTLARELQQGSSVVPVPLHWQRRMARGYNQAEALAQGLGRVLRLPVRSSLRRVARTPALANLGRTERAGLMREAFRARRDPRIEGRTILLVDDILTSGATSGAAARALKKAGASRVVLVVVGRAEGRP